MPAACRPRRPIGIGCEYRQKPNNPSAFHEQPDQDVFVAWLPSKHVALTAAYARLGTIASQRDQQGLHLSTQVGD